jgi:hypothetical protein
MRVAQGEDPDVGGSRQLAHEVTERRDAPIIGIGTEPGDDQADVHGWPCRTASSV